MKRTEKGSNTTKVPEYVQGENCVPWCLISCVQLDNPTNSNPGIADYKPMRH